uniref:Three-finger toxin 2 n=1 Tax=Micrurus tener TaxID=1114301 RepID=A0A194APG0_9SAUR
MKTLLLTMAMVGFMCLESVHTRICIGLGRWLYVSPVKCLEGENLCYSAFKMNPVFGIEQIRGCTKDCTYPEPVLSIECCSTDKCNDLL